MFRAPRLPSGLAAGPSCASSSPAATTSIRHYAISIQSPRIWPGKAEGRVFNERKTYLYNQFTSLLNRASSEPLLFVQHKNFRVSGMIKLRREITAATMPKGSQFSLLDAPPAPETLPQLNIISTSVFGVALRHHAPTDETTTAQIAKMAGGAGLGVLSLPALDPPTLQAVLRALERSVPRKKAVDAQAKKATDDETHVPGRKTKRRRPMLDPELVLLGALIEGKVFGVEGVKDVSKLPTLDTIRAQIVGLLSSPAVQLAMVLGEAGGGKLARTLEGLKKGLEDKQGTNTEEASVP
ncbi:hypothetical protein DFH11DRAFT_1619169 [Phellopilus nigrolimitatus]|nr:hypothetical protein DFH11DRAFT_1619169 [Phellopilus nigrolimitatus]